MNIIPIESLNDPCLEAYVSLTDSQLRNCLEPEKGIFIAESEKVIAVALKAGYTPLSILCEEKRITGSGREIINMCGDIPVYTAARQTIAGLTGYELTRGILCAMRRQKERTVDEICCGARRIAVFEDITDSSNIGALFRSAAALGIDGVVLSPSCCDPLCRRGIRVSMGTVLLIPWARFEGNQADWRKNGTDYLHKQGFAVAALALRNDSIPPDSPVLLAEKRLALVLGTEGTGLCSETVEKSDYTVRIPMARGIDSLNVAAAAAIAFYQVMNRGKRLDRGKR